MNLASIRAGLPVVERLAYLNAGTFGPLPARTIQTVERQNRTELEAGRCGASYWDDVRDLRRRAREAIGRAIGAPADAVALTRSTTDGCNIAVSALRLQPGDEVVTTDAEHFGLLGALAASKLDVRVAEVNTRPAADAAEIVKSQITPKTRLIALSHVLWTTGHVIPVEQLADAGIPVLVDGAQSVGAAPLDVASLGCTFYTVSGQKWLLGPDGTGALYVNPEQLTGLDVCFPSYFSQQSYEDDGTFVPTDGAARFDNGTVPAPALGGLLESIAFAEEVGSERFAYARATAERCRQALAERVEVVTEPGQSTLVSFRPNGEATETVERLASQGVVVRELPRLGWVRASVGFWTSDDDVDRLVAGS